MDSSRKEANIQIGKRLREARSNLGRTQAEIADMEANVMGHGRVYPW
jgi:hypothetical protein